MFWMGSVVVVVVVVVRFWGLLRDANLICFDGLRVVGGENRMDGRCGGREGEEQSDIERERESERERERWGRPLMLCLLPVATKCFGFRVNMTLRHGVKRKLRLVC